MSVFEKWADDCDESDERYYAIPVGSAARLVAKDAFIAGMKAADERACSVQDALSNAVDEPGVSADRIQRASMEAMGAAKARVAILTAILEETGK